jgi:hypothetical protein
MKDLRAVIGTADLLYSSAAVASTATVLFSSIEKTPFFSLSLFFRFEPVSQQFRLHTFLPNIARKILPHTLPLGQGLAGRFGEYIITDLLYFR